MTFIFLFVNQLTAVSCVQGNLTRVHHRLKRNDNDHYRHDRETIISIVDKKEMTRSNEENEKRQ
jgi:hypothetical protein